jgi:hypothetical protein
MPNTTFTMTINSNAIVPHGSDEHLERMILMAIDGLNRSAYRGQLAGMRRALIDTLKRIEGRAA